jgi:hypothetical protein
LALIERFGIDSIDMKWKCHENFETLFINM